ncbi:hypothetical protein [Actinosynnema sp. ALI-1.44]|uniref:hypothetical protein n=1 Tax=Actinosynnema sp. ALI-1.44 TaxID=1933779 RepID=UPI001EDA7F86|nr:hypothetical protein [Actinosynnema sp. ALI-1.44]
MFQELDEAVQGTLAVLERVAAEGDDHAAAALARTEVAPLVRAVRVLLREHRPDENGCCAVCRRRWWQWRRPNVPCRVYLAARLALLDEPDAGARHALRIV